MVREYNPLFLLQKIHIFLWKCLVGCGIIMDTVKNANIAAKAANRSDLMSEKKEPQEKMDWKKSLVLYLHDVVYYLIIIAVLFLLVFRVVVVSGTSMNMTLYNGDYLLLLSNTFYHAPQHGDIVVISKESFDNGTPIVKRIIATEGQVVDIDFVSGLVYVDGVALDEPYINSPTSFNEGTVFPLTVAEDCIFVLGDNRGVSRDSRDPVIGQIDKREVLGKAIFLMLPGTSHGNLPRDMGRIGVVQ